MLISFRSLHFIFQFIQPLRFIGAARLVAYTLKSHMQPKLQKLHILLTWNLSILNAAVCVQNALILNVRNPRAYKISQSIYVGSPLIA